MSAAPTMPVNPVTRSDKSTARALAVLMHVAFIVLLVFGVSWQKKPEPPVMADLWSALPPMPQPKAEVTPEPEPPPKPAPRVEAPPVPKMEPKPVIKPDIALKKPPEKKVEPKPEPKVDPKKLEEEKAEKARLQKDAEAKKKRDEAELKRLRDEKDAIAKADAQRSAQASEQSKLIAQYIDRIQNKVRQNIVEPPGLQGNPTAVFDVVLLPGGDVLNVRLLRSSGVPAYDAAAERAILKSAPLPLPPNPELFAQFRDLRLNVRPRQ